MKRVWASAIFAAVVLLGAGVVRLAAGLPRGPSVRLISPPTPELLVVHVAGAVLQPGVYRLPAGSRTQDAVEAAGGFSADADSDAVNLAALLDDEEQIFVPRQGQSPQPSPEKQDQDQAGEAGPLVNINTALQAELETLPGIGPVLAQRILAYREEHGPFATIEELVDVPGIGPEKFEHLKTMITAGTSP